MPRHTAAVPRRRGLRHPRGEGVPQRGLCTQVLHQAHLHRQGGGHRVRGELGAGHRQGGPQRAHRLHHRLRHWPQRPAAPAADAEPGGGAPGPRRARVCAVWRGGGAGGQLRGAAGGRVLRAGAGHQPLARGADVAHAAHLRGVRLERAAAELRLPARGRAVRQVRGHRPVPHRDGLRHPLEAGAAHRAAGRAGRAGGRAVHADQPGPEQAARQVPRDVPCPLRGGGGGVHHHVVALVPAAARRHLRLVRPRAGRGVLPRQPADPGAQL
mmetsp:Transcript_39710/g.102841  ORF Transcript_39710/g.102841 Transcript_39710/m.102841 type:complete len:269 (-) Transcript_39710:1363-2169(-)